MGSGRAGLLAAIGAVGFIAAAAAQPVNQPQGAGGQPPTAVAEPETSDQPSAGSASAPPSIQTSLGPYGDPGGLRGTLSAHGIEYSLTYIGEALGNPSGGIRRGSIYEGRLDAQLDIDLEKLAGWGGATFHTNGYVIHGPGLSRHDLGNLFVASGIEALPSERLYELWLEQKLLDGKVGVRVGQLAADTEFFVSQTASLFVNATFGWPAITAANLPSGGPAYPLATPGIRVKVAPSEDLSLLLGLFDGDPAGPARAFQDPDPLRRDPSGTNFRTSDPPLLMAEGAYSYRLPVTGEGLTGTAKLGYWHHFGRFNDELVDGLGVSLADPAGSGLGRRLRGNDGIYGIVDQTIYRVPGTTDQGASVFVRLSGSPGDRNLVDIYVDGGIAYKGLFPSRPDDTLGLSAAYARVSDRVRQLDFDTVLYSGLTGTVRSSEAMLELTYQATVVPGFTVQPDFQYIFSPGAGAANPRDPSGARIRDAAVLGLRTTIRY